MIEKAIKKNVLQMLKSYLCMEGGSEKKWSSVEEKSTRDHIEVKMLLEFAESGCPIFRATTPLSRSKLKSKGHGKLIHYGAEQATIETIFE